MEWRSSKRVIEKKIWENWTTIRRKQWISLERFVREWKEQRTWMKDNRYNSITCIYERVIIPYLCYLQPILILFETIFSHFASTVLTIFLLPITVLFAVSHATFFVSSFHLWSILLNCVCYCSVDDIHCKYHVLFMHLPSYAYSM